MVLEVYKSAVPKSVNELLYFCIGINLQQAWIQDSDLCGDGAIVVVSGFVMNWKKFSSSESYSHLPTIHCPSQVLMHLGVRCCLNFSLDRESVTALPMIRKYESCPTHQWASLMITTLR